MSLNKRRAISQLEHARLTLERGELAKCEALVREVLESGFDEPPVFTLLGETLRQQGKTAEARTVLDDGLRKHPGEPELEARIGSVLLDQDEPRKAVEFFARAQKKLQRDPQLLTAWAAALVRLGKAVDAEALLARALLVGAGPDARLVLAAVKMRRGQYDEADRIASKVEAMGVDALIWPARALRADIKLMRGDATGSLKAFQEIEKAGQLQSWSLAHMAWAAALAGEMELADSLIATRLAKHPDGDDLVLFANIANLRGEASKALEFLDRAAGLKKTEPASDFEYLSARGRALRLAGRTAEAMETLTAATASPDAELPKLGAAPFIDLGHLAADGGDFEKAETHFRRALQLDPHEPEAKRGLELTLRRLGWRQALEASTEERVAQAQAEAEAVRRRFVVRETEVERLKREIEQLKSQRTHAEKEAQRLTVEAEAERQRLAEQNRTQLQKELVAREADVENKALENLESVFGTRRDACPEALWQRLVVAERMFQQAMYNEIPAAAVAVLFSGAFERSLGDLLAADFGVWLDRHNLRSQFLERGVRERRGSRVEYFDRFFEWFDREQNARPPSLGEVARVLEKRKDSHLVAYEKFLTESFALEPSFWDDFSRFVTWSKETLRDPVAHGHIELDWDGLKKFREQLLFDFAGQKPGAMPRLLRARRKT
ncbi:MAG: tetratricopeptide repeat protein [Archangium sp.]